MLLRLLAMVWLLVLVACESQIAPPLVEVTEVAPREVELGDRLEIHGKGFPQGRVGRIHLEGTVARPGELPLRGVSVEAEGVVQAPDRLEVVIRDAFVDRLCGRGDHAVHASFVADLEVSFASSIAGAKPLVGRLRGARLEVLPSTASAVSVEDRRKEGIKVLAFLGITAGAPGGRGLPVEQIAPESQAARAGVQVGDLLASVDGVHLLSAADVAPASARSTEIGIIHGDSSEEETKTLSLVEYSGERIPIEYVPAFLLVGLAIALLVVIVLPGPSALRTIEMRIAARVRRTTLGATAAAFFGGRHAAVLVLLSAVIAALGMTPWIIGREVDGVVLLFAVITLLVGARVAKERGFFATLRAVFQTGLAGLAITGALALAIAQVGAIELAELARLQGGAPWQFTAARHPACAVAALVYCAGLVALLRHDGLSLRTRAGVLLGAALGVMVFFGGGQLASIEPRQTSATLLVAGAVVVVKTWALAATLLGASRVLAKLEAHGIQSLVVKRLVPALVLAAVFVAVSRRFAASAALETAFGGTLVALAFLFAVRVASRVRAALLQPEPHASTVA